MWNVKCEAVFFLLAFFHLPIMDEKLVHPPQLLHGLCPFVLSHKGSSLTFVFYSLHAYTSLQTSHIADFMHKDISYPYVFFFCKEGVPKQLLQSGEMALQCVWWLYFKASFFFLSLVLICTLQEQKFDLLDAQKVLLQMKAQKRLLTQVAGKYAFCK